MADVLIRDVPDQVVAAIDAAAKRLGLSRIEYLRRELGRHAGVPSRRVTPADLVGFSEVFADLEDPEVMDAAWR